VIGVQHEEHVEGVGDLVGDLVVRAERHPQEVADVPERRVRVDGVLSAPDALDRGGQGRAATEESGGGQVDGLGVVDVQVVTVGPEEAHAGRQDGHRVGIPGEGLQQRHHLAGQRRLGEHLLGELGELGLRGVLTVDEQVGDLEEGRVVGELVDRVPAVTEDALVAVDVGDRGGARGGVDEPDVQGRHPRLGQQGTQLHRVASAGRFHHIEFELTAGVGQCCIAVRTVRACGHAIPSPTTGPGGLNPATNVLCHTLP